MCCDQFYYLCYFLKKDFTCATFTSLEKCFFYIYKKIKKLINQVKTNGRLYPVAEP